MLDKQVIELLQISVVIYLPFSAKSRHSQQLGNWPRLAMRPFACVLDHGRHSNWLQGPARATGGLEECAAFSSPVCASFGAYTWSVHWNNRRKSGRSRAHFAASNALCNCQSPSKSETAREIDWFELKMIYDEGS